MKQPISISDIFNSDEINNQIEKYDLKNIISKYKENQEDKKPDKNISNKSSKVKLVIQVDNNIQDIIEDFKIIYSRANKTTLPSTSTAISNLILLGVRGLVGDNNTSQQKKEGGK